MPIRALIADDQTVVREGFTLLLNAQSDIEVVGQAADGLEAVARTAELQPDVVLMDIRMPVLNGIEATRRITQNPGEPARILVLTTFDFDDYVYDALHAGASGFLLKDASADQLAQAVRIIAAGDALLAPAITRRLISHFTRTTAPRMPVTGRTGPLTERETEILTLIAQGLSNAEIAAHLIIAEQTVKTHVGRILSKLTLRDRTQAAIHAFETGLVRPRS
ncbi:response regulator transcription factor (plasmid) [Kitasatospora sp. NBC_00070]|uniref:response regulator transcription factor n=1 Tax=Kitasatospora sp. NBC_00070 TaxID=2975962 RepID=UPI002F915581